MKANIQHTVEELLLKTAEEVFIDKGYAGAKTTEIAKRAGVTHAMLHYYFRTKDNLFQTIFEKKIAAFKGSLKGFVFKPGMKLREILEGLVGAQFDFLAASPGLPRFILNSMQDHEGLRSVVLNTFLSELAEIAVPLQAAIDQEASNGNAEQISARDLMFDIASVNAFLFTAYPMSYEMGRALYGDEETFLKARREENVRLILRRVMNKF